MPERAFKPGEFRVLECGNITTSDGEIIKGAIIEFPAGPPDGMTFGDVWDGTAFTLAKCVTEREPETND